MSSRGLRGPARAALRLALTPLRRAAARLVRRFPALGPRISRRGWLWQPGWSRGHHERFYDRGEDPYGFDSSPTERAKYDETLGLLEGRRFERALEVGASEGAFTERLLEVCGNVVAVEVSATALERAGRRLAGRPGLTLERRTLPFDAPEGSFDLVVCSDVLYLWELEALRSGLDLFAQRLRPGGVLVLVHYRGSFGGVLSADDVHAEAVRLAPELGLEVVEGTLAYRGPHGEDDAGYLVHLLRRP